MARNLSWISYKEGNSSAIAEMAAQSRTSQILTLVWEVPVFNSFFLTQ